VGSFEKNKTKERFKRQPHALVRPSDR